MAKKQTPHSGQEKATSGRSSAPKVYYSSVSDLVPDDKNANLGTEYGDRILEKSLSTLGAGRSVLVDKDNRLIAGNKTAEKCVEIGVNKAIVVETTGDTLVVVKRTDVSLDSKQGRELALADNKVGESNLDWDHNVVADIAAMLKVDGDFMPTPKPKRRGKMTITIVFDDESEMDEALDEIREMQMEKWQSAEVKAKK